MGKPQYHVAIVGAGLGGLAAAIGIARAGHKVTIIEQAKELSEIGAGIQLPPNTTIILQRWGLLDKIAQHASLPRHMVWRSYRDGAILWQMQAHPYTTTRYGYPYYFIHRAAYHRVLSDEAYRLGVTIKLGCTVTGIDFSTPAVRIQDQPDFYADMVVGADGLKSTCREALLQKPDPPQLTGDLAYRITIKAEDMQAHPELVELITDEDISVWMGPHGHAVCYPIHQGRLYNIVAVAPDNLPELVQTQAADLEEMREIFKHWDPRLRKLLKLVENTAKWRLQNSEEMAEWSHESGRFALLGDACHATLPYMAQGAAMAVEDGAVLGALLEGIESRGQLKDVLVVYEDLRKPRTTRVVKASSKHRTVFHMPDGERQVERDRQLREQPDGNTVIQFSDKEFEAWLFGYDAFEEVEKAWKKYKQGRWPLTFGYWNDGESRKRKAEPEEGTVSNGAKKQ